jgi:hypothetical protein
MFVVVIYYILKISEKCNFCQKQIHRKRPTCTFFHPTMLLILLLAVICCQLPFSTASEYSFIDARNRFQNTVLIVKYNYKAPPGPVLLHLHMWSKVFVNQLIYISWDEAECAEFNAKNLDVNGTIAVVSKLEPYASGYMAYEVVSLAMRSHPNYEGYLFAHDDMAMNISALMELDLKKTWMSDWIHRDSCRDLEYGWTNHTNGWWWDGEWGCTAIDKFLANNTAIANEMIQTLGSKYVWCGEQSDFFYLPNSFKKIFLRVMEPMAAFGIFLEIAVPTFWRVYVPPSKVLKLSLCSTFDLPVRLNTSTLFQYYENTCGDSYPLYHPVKLSCKNNVAGMRKKMGLTGGI